MLKYKLQTACHTLCVIMALLSDLVIPFSVFKELAASRVSDRDQLNSHSYDAAAIGNFLSLIIIVKKSVYILTEN